MPFQSEKQRRYLWANEPEIARDWTDTYGSGIARALGGRIGLRRGSGPGPGGQGARGQATQNPGTGGRNEPPGGGDRAMTYTAPTTPSSTPLGGDRIIDLAQRKKRQDVRDLIARQQAEKDYTRQGIMKTGPQLGFAPTRGPNIGNWASGLAGSKIGGGLGSMLLGPWGMLLGSLFGRGVGQRAYAARQTPEKETMKDIMLGQNTFLSNLFNKPTTGGEGLGGIDLSDMRDKIYQEDPGAVGIENKFADDNINNLYADVSRGQYNTLKSLGQVGNTGGSADEIKGMVPAGTFDSITDDEWNMIFKGEPFKAFG